MVDRATKMAARPGRPDVSDGCCSTDGSLVADTDIKVAQPIVCGQEDMEYATNRPFAETWDEGLLAPVGVIMSRGCRGLRSCVGW